GGWRQAEVGFELFARETSVATSLGLSDRSRVIAVDDVPVRDPTDLVGLYQSIASERRVRLTVAMGEQEQQLVWHLSGPTVDVVVTTADLSFVDRNEETGPPTLPEGTAPDALTTAALTTEDHLDPIGRMDGIRLSDLTRSSPFA